MLRASYIVVCSSQYTDRILRAGIALFPNSAYTHILYANFLIEVQSLYQVRCFTHSMVVWVLGQFGRPKVGLCVSFR